MKKYLCEVVLALSLIFAGTVAADNPHARHDQAFLSSLAQQTQASISSILPAAPTQPIPLSSCTTTFCNTNQDCWNAPGCAIYGQGGTFCCYGGACGGAHRCVPYWSTDVLPAQPAAPPQARISGAATNQIINANQALANAARDSVAETKRLADAAQISNVQALKASAGQREAAQESLSEAKSSLIISQRAWLSPKGFMGNDAPAPDALFRATAIIENVGKSPAQDVRTVQRIIVSKFGEGNEGPPLSLLGLTPKDQAVAVIGGGQFIFATAQVTIPGSYLDKVKAGEVRIFFIARAIYRDIFGENCETDLCYIYAPSSNEWVSCLSGNSMR